MIRIGIFGGSFDPPHIGHLRVAQQAANELQLEQVLWIPAAYSPHKSFGTTSKSAWRLDMVRILIQHDSRFQIDTRELVRQGPSFTVETLESLKSEFPISELFLILGEDSFKTLSTWKNPSRIRELSSIVVYKRVSSGREGMSGDLGTYDHLLSGPPVDVTSTDIRKRISQNNAVDHLVTPEVANYIKDHRLYLQG